MLALNAIEGFLIENLDFFFVPDADTSDGEYSEMRSNECSLGVLDLLLLSSKRRLDSPRSDEVLDRSKPDVEEPSPSRSDIDKPLIVIVSNLI